MYIPAAPWCPRNEAYAKNVRDAFLTGSSPGDFPEEHYEREWVNRFREDQLNQTGRRGLGLDWARRDSTAPSVPALRAVREGPGPVDQQGRLTARSAGD